MYDPKEHDELQKALASAARINEFLTRVSAIGTEMGLGEKEILTAVAVIIRLYAVQKHIAVRDILRGIEKSLAENEHLFKATIQKVRKGVH